MSDLPRRMNNVSDLQFENTIHIPNSDLDGFPFRPPISELENLPPAFGFGVVAVLTVQR